MTVTPTSSALVGLADRLTHTQDRESYSALMCYLNRLPPGDEFRQLAELLGLLSLVGQRIPDALAEFLTEFRTQTKIAVEYQGNLQARLADLPQEIAAGVDPMAIAKEMSESFRQQLAASGLQDTAALLKAAVITLKTLSGEVATVLKPTATILTNETANLLTAKRQLDEQNKRFLHEYRAKSWIVLCLVGMLTFLLGVFYGEIMGKRTATDLLSNIAVELKQHCDGFGPTKAR